MRLAIVLLVTLFLSTAFSGIPPTPYDGGDREFDSVTVGDAITEEDTEYTIFEAPNADGDALMRLTIICSDLTPGSEDCTVKIYEIVGGALTNQGTWP